MKKILIYGYGNPGRQDDGLGIDLAHSVEKWSIKNKYSGISVDVNYQLNIEDAYNLNLYNIVIFADASRENISDYKYEELFPDFTTNFSMHAVSPGLILSLCEQLYQTRPRAFLLHIKGYEWEFMEGMTDKAVENLKKALNFLQKKIESIIFCEISK